MELDAEFFVAAGFVLFVALMAYMGVHRTLTAAIDERAKKITAELGEALRLRTEAESLLSSFKKKAQEAEVEALAIVTQAKSEAEALAKDAEVRVAEFVKRRTAQAEQKIAQAEAQAQSDVKAAAAEAAVKAAEIILKAETTGDMASQFIVKGITDLKSGLGA
jgi:F-type H+-transporting ATPase subunit b